MTLIHFLLITDRSRFIEEVTGQFGFQPDGGSLLTQALDILVSESPPPNDWEIAVNGTALSSNGSYWKSGHHHDYVWMAESVPGWIFL